MRAVKKKKKSIFLRIALLAFSVYVIVMLIQLQLQINESERDIDGYDQKIAAYVRMNEDLQNKSDNYEKYQEQQARKKGLTKPNETIIIEVPGD